MGLRIPPYVFTELGVAMLSSVLNSDQAIEVDISIMRIFYKLRSFLLMEEELNRRIDQLESGDNDLKTSTNHLLKIVFERLDNLEECLQEHPKDRKKIGITSLKG